MLTPSDIRQQALNKYPAFVETHFRGEPFFPWEVRFGRADAGETLGRLRQDIETLLSESHAKTGRGYRVDMADRRLRLHGMQSLPSRVWFDTEDDYLSFIGLRSEFLRLKSDIEEAALDAPMASQWLRANARCLLSRLPRGDGRALGLALRALHANPLPGCFAREIPLQGVSGKFIEGAVDLIADILKAIESPAWRPGEDVHASLGLKRPSRLIRAMLLDGARADYGLPLDRLCQPEGVSSVIIVENLRSFLTLPAVSGVLALWGEGHAARALAASAWLRSMPVFYWGDIDPHGFAILNGLRSVIPSIRSVMMDQECLSAYSGLLAQAEPLSAPRFDLLSPLEMAAALQTQRDAMGVEQEKIPVAEASSAIKAAFRSLTT